MTVRRRSSDRTDDERLALRTENEKVVARFRSDGTVRTDTYWGGAGNPDGRGHGHAVVDQDGQLRYLRESAVDSPGSPRSERVTTDDRRVSRESRRAALRERDRTDRSAGRDQR